MKILCKDKFSHIPLGAALLAMCIKMWQHLQIKTLGCCTVYSTKCTFSNVMCPYGKIRDNNAAPQEKYDSLMYRVQCHIFLCTAFAQPSLHLNVYIKSKHHDGH